MTTLATVAVICLLAPLVHGAMRTLRARLAGRPGPPIHQPYRDLAKLWSKEAILPDGVSPLALLAPGLAVGIALVFAAVLPLSQSVPSSFVDVVALAMLLALGRFVLALVALDSRSGFAGMAASREMTFASLVEPSLLMALLGGAVLGRGSSFQGLTGVPFGVAAALAVAAFFLAMLSETARVPIDNQETHYELTMIHEGLALEYSGWQLALVQYAAQLRALCFLLLASVLLPGQGVEMRFLWLCILAVAITLVETWFAKVRLFEVPQLLTIAIILSMASICLRIAGPVL